MENLKGRIPPKRKRNYCAQGSNDIMPVFATWYLNYLIREGLKWPSTKGDKNISYHKHYQEQNSWLGLMASLQLHIQCEFKTAMVAETCSIQLRFMDMETFPSKAELQNPTLSKKRNLYTALPWTIHI